MSAVPSLLVAAGLTGQACRLGARLGRRLGLILVLASLVIPALVDLVSGALWPPLLAPMLVVGAIVIGVTGRRNPDLGGLTRLALFAIGVLLVAAFCHTE